MKLSEALFREQWNAYRVLGDYVDDWENFNGWELLPVDGTTLAPAGPMDPFQGFFIIAALMVSSGATPQRCYMDLTLPERISEYHFVRSEGNERITRRRGLHLRDGTVIPAIGIESLGVYKLFFADQNPQEGIKILQKGMQSARHPGFLALDLAYLLRDEKKYEDAIEAFTAVLADSPGIEIVQAVYKERAQLYMSIGHPDKAKADNHEYARLFQEQFGHPPQEVNDK